MGISVTHYQLAESGEKFLFEPGVPDLQALQQMVPSHLLGKSLEQVADFERGFKDLGWNYAEWRLCRNRLDFGIYRHVELDLEIEIAHDNIPLKDLEIPCCYGRVVGDVDAGLDGVRSKFGPDQVLTNKSEARELVYGCEDSEYVAQQIGLDLWVPGKSFFVISY